MTTPDLPALTPAVIEQICEKAIAGNSLTAIAKDIGTTRKTIWRWRQSNPLFDQALLRALEEGAHAQIDETIDIADNKEIDAQRARNMIGARQWAAERRYRKVYGASVDVNLTERVDIGGALIEARKRVVLPGSDLTQITDAQVIDVSPYNATWTKDKETAAHVPVVNPFD